MSTEEQVEKTSTDKPKKTGAEKIEEAYGKLKDLIANEASKEGKSENQKVLAPIVKSAIKSFEGGKKAMDWKETGDKIALFTRIQEPTTEEVRKALIELTVHYLHAQANAPDKEDES